MNGVSSSLHIITPEDRQKQAEQKAMEDAQVWTLPGGGKQNVGDFRAQSTEQQWSTMGLTPPWAGGSYDLGGTPAPPYRNPNIPTRPPTATPTQLPSPIDIGAPTATPTQGPTSDLPSGNPGLPTPAPSPTSQIPQPAGQGIPGYSKPQSFNVDQLMKFLTPQSPFQAYNFDDPFSDSSTGNNPF